MFRVQGSKLKTSTLKPQASSLIMLAALLDILFPPLCHLCRQFIRAAGPVHICADCLSDIIPIDSPLCMVCGIPFLTEGGSDHLCGVCRTAYPPFASARAAFRFDGSVRELIHRFKYNRKVQLRRPLGILTAGSLGAFAAETCADLLVPVPLHVRRLRERGYNQAVLLGEVLAKEWRLPLSRDNLCRIRWTEPQINLPAAERMSNVKGAFAVSRPEKLKGRRVILVDDVMTTGSTVTECAGVLRRAGAEEVFAVTVARAV